MKSIEIGKAIELLMKKTGKTKVKTCEYLGIARSTLDNYLNGETSPTFDVLLKLSSFFAITIPEMYDLSYIDSENPDDEMNYEKMAQHFTLDKNEPIKSADKYVLRGDLDRERLLHDKLISSYEENINLLKEKADGTDKRSDKALIDYMGGSVAEDAPEPPKRKAANW